MFVTFSSEKIPQLGKQNSHCCCRASVKFKSGSEQGTTQYYEDSRRAYYASFTKEKR